MHTGGKFEHAVEIRVNHGDDDFRLKIAIRVARNNAKPNHRIQRFGNLTGTTSGAWHLVASPGSCIVRVEGSTPKPFHRSPGDPAAGSCCIQQ